MVVLFPSLVVHLVRIFPHPLHWLREDFPDVRLSNSLDLVLHLPGYVRTFRPHVLAVPDALVVCLPLVEIGLDPGADVKDYCRHRRDEEEDEAGLICGAVCHILVNVPAESGDPGTPVTFMPFQWCSRTS